MVWLTLLRLAFPINISELSAVLEVIRTLLCYLARRSIQFSRINVVININLAKIKNNSQFILQIMKHKLKFII